MHLLTVTVVLIVSCSLPCWAGENVTTVASSELRDPEQVDEAANTMFEEYWQIVLMESPEFATMVGDHRYDDRLSSYSLNCYEKKKVVKNEFLERANQLLPLAHEGTDTHHNLEQFITNLQFELDSLMSGSHLFPFSQLNTPQMELRHTLKYIQPNVTQDYWNLIARYRAIPKQIDEQIELMKEGIRTNYTLSERSMFYETVQLNQSVEDSPFYKLFKNISSFISTEDADAIRLNASDAILNHVLPAYKKAQDFLENEYKLHLRPDIGVSSMPNGREYYRHRLIHHLTDSDVTPEQIHQTGLAEVERISQEMDEVIHSLGLNLSRKEFSDQLRNNESHFFSSEDEALNAYRKMLNEDIRPKLLMLFKTIPEKELTVEKIPENMSTGPRAYYMRSSVDGTTPATFFLDTSSLQNLPRYELATLALHEGLPGHHFQISYAMELRDVPEFRKHDSSNAFIEGWALYAEFLGYEMGLYEDPIMRYGHLSEEIFRACRMVVDTGMHVLGWSRSKAIEYMMNNTAATLNNVEREVDRYITWPGQACSYKFGELKIKELRNKAQNELGVHFDIKEFHDIILKNNGPLDLVGKAVDRYIATSKENALQY